MKRTIVVIGFLLGLSTLVLAHGSEHHVMGTVTAVNNASIAVKTPAGKIVTVQLGSKTQFTKSGSPASVSDLKVGDKVVIHATMDGDKLVAHVVKSGAMPKGAQGSGHDTHQHDSH